MYYVSANQLNLRSTPVAQANGHNILAVLPNGLPVTKIEDAGAAGWWKVSVNLQGTEFGGYVNSAYLTQVFQPVTQRGVSEVYMPFEKSGAARNNRNSPAYQLAEPDMPRRDLTSALSKVASIGNILNWLNVEQSLRYQKIGLSTFCNIYAFDFCFLAGVYIPRVWWKGDAIAKLIAGQQVPVSYEVTVEELLAEAMLNWLNSWGSTFGWIRAASLTDLQNRANEGKVCLLAAKRRLSGLSGHIVVVVPETNAHQAKRNASGEVTIPLQSQAGASNNKYFSNSRWWLSQEGGLPKFSEFVLYSHD